jgi:anaerobic ribonucleoside-triphosphate reductase activating protein
MQVRLFGLVNDSIVDGPGIRLALFFQGCPYACPGCHNQDSWDPNGGYLEDTDVIIKKWRANPLIEGITFSGGEALMQKDAVLYLAKVAKADGLNLTLYTGNTFENLQKQNDPVINEILSLLDYLVDGPFVLALKDPDLPYRGSSNQRLIDVKATLKTGKVVNFNPF